MSKRKSGKSRHPASAKPNAADSAAARRPAIPAVNLATSEGHELQAAPTTETKLPKVSGQETELKLPPVPPAELEAQPLLPPHLARPEPVLAAPVGVRAEAEEAKWTATDEVGSAVRSPAMDTLPQAIVGMKACQTLLVEMRRDNLDLVANIAAMRSPLEILDVSTKFASNLMGTYGRFWKTLADIAASDVRDR
ncbi:hypothetical protein ACQR1W_38455 [Bradyrhizobium sp. HKCCYLS1011]|uniref:hypothetical protein n=1 Tax=Bradyrhizobium sp. HKCCYLS1011 TaxID=3420733 RepID=UPI003EBB408C